MVLWSSVPGSPYLTEIKQARIGCISRLFGTGIAIGANVRESRAVQVRRFGELETVVMDRVWDHGGAVTVRGVFDDLAHDRRIAYTTVMSTMDNLHRKGWLQRERVGKAFSYWPTMTREEHSARLMHDAFDAGGDSDLVLAFFLKQMDEHDAVRVRDALRRIIDDQEES